MSGFEEHSLPDQMLEIEQRSWLPRHVRGDKKAFEKLVRTYEQPIFSYLVRCGLNRQTREDLFQEIFMRIHRAADTYQPHRPLRPWLFTISANVVRNYFRSHKFNEVAETDIESQQPELDETLAVCEALEWLEQAIPKLLPFGQAEVLILTTVNGLQQQDVADILDMPLNTVKTQLSRARKTLTQAWLQRQGQLPQGDTP
ncbi:MAG: RNA polymerase sigma factor [Gammaproteobacteria bacterium]|nr:RNA polymerase sigma factor [Gammaproteobacteria bacterium]MDH5800437.1 RNA polymerase sigma factor [Gammaproteobacteria bacterium]